MSGVSDIKLIRTDTTLDLSQKAEKRCLWKERSKRPFPCFSIGLVGIKTACKPATNRLNLSENVSKIHNKLIQTPLGTKKTPN